MSSRRIVQNATEEISSSLSRWTWLKLDRINSVLSQRWKLAFNTCKELLDQRSFIPRLHCVEHLWSCRTTRLFTTNAQLIARQIKVKWSLSTKTVMRWSWEGNRRPRRKLRQYTAIGLWLISPGDWRWLCMIVVYVMEINSGPCGLGNLWKCRIWLSNSSFKRISLILKRIISCSSRSNYLAPVDLRTSWYYTKFPYQLSSVHFDTLLMSRGPSAIAEPLV